MPGRERVTATLGEMNATYSDVAEENSRNFSRPERRAIVGLTAGSLCVPISSAGIKTEPQGVKRGGPGPLFAIS